MSDSFASIDVSITSRPRARFNAALNKSIIDCGRVKVYLHSVEDVHSLIDDLQSAVREMARHQEAEAAK
ncbi:hypothetical protein DVG80_04125 [Rhodococcus erythropolis]|nr:hypothetical protein DVG80_04125 [Rhodococcus erythropolis]